MEAGYVQHLWKAKIPTIHQDHKIRIQESQNQTTGIPVLSPLSARAYFSRMGLPLKDCTANSQVCPHNKIQK